MGHLLARLGALITLLALWSACAATPAREALRQEQVVDGITITLETAKEPKRDQAYPFVVTLADAQGKPIDGADVYLELEMPAMPMGSNRPVTTPLGAGRYTVTTAYTMTGEWNVVVVATISGAERRAAFINAVAQ